MCWDARYNIEPACSPAAANVRVQPDDFFPRQLIFRAPAHDRQHIALLDERATLRPNLATCANMDRSQPSASYSKRPLRCGWGASVISIMRRSLALSPHHPGRPRNRSCDSITDNSSCARFKPARALSELRLRSLSIQRSAAATRSRARSKSATVYCGGSRRVRFFLGPFVTLLVRTAALSRVPVAIVPFRLFRRIG
jgi:hypothetical protein